MNTLQMLRIFRPPLAIRLIRIGATQYSSDAAAEVPDSLKPRAYTADVTLRGANSAVVPSQIFSLYKNAIRQYTKLSEDELQRMLEQRTEIFTCQLGLLQNFFELLVEYGFSPAESVTLLKYNAKLCESTTKASLMSKLQLLGCFQLSSAQQRAALIREPALLAVDHEAIKVNAERLVNLFSTREMNRLVKHNAAILLRDPDEVEKIVRYVVTNMGFSIRDALVEFADAGLVQRNRKAAAAMSGKQRAKAKQAKRKEASNDRENEATTNASQDAQELVSREQLGGAPSRTNVFLCPFRHVRARHLFLVYRGAFERRSREGQEENERPRRESTTQLRSSSVEGGAAQRNASLRQILLTSDAEFCKRVAQCSLDEYLAFAELVTADRIRVPPGFDGEPMRHAMRNYLGTQGNRSFAETDFLDDSNVRYAEEYDGNSDEAESGVYELDGDGDTEMR